MSHGIIDKVIVYAIATFLKSQIFLFCSSAQVHIGFGGDYSRASFALEEATLILTVGVVPEVGNESPCLRTFCLASSRTLAGKCGVQDPLESGCTIQFVHSVAAPDDTRFPF